MKLVRERILKAAQSKHVSYLQAFLSEKEQEAKAEEGFTFDPIELSLYISRRLQTDNDWLVDKLA